MSKYKTAIIKTEIGERPCRFAVYAVEADGKEIGICRHVSEEDALDAAFSVASRVKREVCFGVVSNVNRNTAKRKTADMERALAHIETIRRRALATEWTITAFDPLGRAGQVFAHDIAAAAHKLMRRAIEIGWQIAPDMAECRIYRHMCAVHLDTSARSECDVKRALDTLAVECRKAVLGRVAFEIVRFREVAELMAELERTIEFTRNEMGLA